ncbi:hypothetical protein BDV95DRAFT_63050 [Massariosphaeria phaeospora]|uniref:Uncharacterized protein n=1 Tax=Massariosphaeria phaeospora TaxID=100035 RepID=A0A7C8M8T1_9PLEO|nr:hypothetical protein BDV95DRAFT_63050 [Massariosphaeria phaeospora]
MANPTPLSNQDELNEPGTTDDASSTVSSLSYDFDLGEEDARKLDDILKESNETTVLSHELQISHVRNIVGDEYLSDIDIRLFFNMTEREREGMVVGAPPDWGVCILSEDFDIGFGELMEERGCTPDRFQRLLVPFCKDQHWTLAIIGGSEHAIFYYNSKSRNDATIVSALGTWVGTVLGPWLGTTVTWSIHTMQAVQQSDASSGGAYVCAFAYVARDGRKIEEHFPLNAGPKLRRWFACALDTDGESAGMDLFE